MSEEDRSGGSSNGDGDQESTRKSSETKSPGTHTVL